RENARAEIKAEIKAEIRAEIRAEVIPEVVAEERAKVLHRYGGAVPDKFKRLFDDAYLESVFGVKVSSAGCATPRQE
ncbi:MAG: hypothetical protein HUK26_05440, partial [Duodenibacillus sp.]|nr:hypothetical protein [Duodenibacillus sp.]